ncbi:hypothetical protein LCGC14_2274480 [marine sediment metagenome]|uniref:Uncharacterized protein n=1 Tax=marine sediment metagenome TaxID=412755 RepID=A0A0F9CVZ2_9ZZZZ
MKTKEQIEIEKKWTVLEAKWQSPIGQEASKKLSKVYREFWETEAGKRAARKASKIMLGFYKNTAYLSAIHDILDGADFTVG